MTCPYPRRSQFIHSHVDKVESSQKSIDLQKIQYESFRRLSTEERNTSTAPSDTSESEIIQHKQLTSWSNITKEYNPVEIPLPKTPVEFCAVFSTDLPTFRAANMVPASPLSRVSNVDAPAPRDEVTRSWDGIRCEVSEETQNSAGSPKSERTDVTQANATEAEASLRPQPPLTGQGQSPLYNREWSPSVEAFVLSDHTATFPSASEHGGDVSNADRGLELSKNTESDFDAETESPHSPGDRDAERSGSLTNGFEKDRSAFAKGDDANRRKALGSAVYCWKFFACRECYMGAIGCEAAFMFCNFAFGSISGGIIALLGLVAAVYAHLDRRLATYSLNATIQGCITIIAIASVSTSVPGFEANFDTSALKALTISYIPVSILFTGLSAYFAYLGFFDASQQTRQDIEAQHDEEDDDGQKFYKECNSQQTDCSAVSSCNDASVEESNRSSCRVSVAHGAQKLLPHVPGQRFPSPGSPPSTPMPPATPNSPLTPLSQHRPVSHQTQHAVTMAVNSTHSPPSIISSPAPCGNGTGVPRSANVRKGGPIRELRNQGGQEKPPPMSSFAKHFDGGRSNRRFASNSLGNSLRVGGSMCRSQTPPPPSSTAWIMSNGNRKQSSSVRRYHSGGGDSNPLANVGAKPLTESEPRADHHRDEKMQSGTRVPPFPNYGTSEPPSLPMLNWR